MLNAIVAFRDQQMCTIERLDEVFLGIRGQSVVADQECSPALLPSMADLADTLSRVQQRLLNAP